MRKLFIDIETAPALAYIWDLKTRYVPISQVAEDGYLLSFAWGWEGEDTVHFMSQWDHGELAMAEMAWELLEEADAVVHYNGNNFDIPRLETEFLVHRLGPPAPAHHIDLYQTAKRFRVLSRSMNHMLRILSMESKLEHKGMELWTGCMNGVKADQKVMQEYNIQDVIVLEQLYNEFLPWIKRHPNAALWMPRSEEPKCVKCGSTDLRFKGYKYTNVHRYKQYKCNSCGSYNRQRFAEDTGKNRRKDVLT